MEKILGQQFRWLGNAGALINSRGTTIMIDPVLSGFDMPLLIEIPLTEKETGHLDSILLTHCDNDYYSRKTCKELASVTSECHAPHYVAGLLESELGISGIGHVIEEKFTIRNISVTLTPAWHNWQNESPKHHTREFAREDYCGYWLDMPDAILFDFSDSRWHIGMEDAIKIAVAYPDTPLILWHWGSVYIKSFKIMKKRQEADGLRMDILNASVFS